MIRQVKAYAAKSLGLGAYLRAPGDGRKAPVVPASDLLWAMLASGLLRDGAFHAVEAWVQSPARRALGVRQPFGDDTLGYFTERLDLATTRIALSTAARHAKRNKAFDDVLAIGLVLDGTTVGHCASVRCPYCHPVIIPRPHPAPPPPDPAAAIGQVVGQTHKLSLLSVVAGDLVLPLDVEPYPTGDCEQRASLRVLERGVRSLGRRFAQYVVADGLYASAPFLNAAGALGLRAVVRLKENVPTLLASAQARFATQPPTHLLDDDGDRVELWDADDFDPWEGLAWPTVRVLRYRQHHRDGTVVEAYWLTDFSSHRLSTRTLYRIAKGRWTIENQGFNDAKNRYGLAHVPHHRGNSLVAHWLLVALTLVIERLFRLRYLHRGTAPTLAAIDLVRRLRLALATALPNTS